MGEERGELPCGRIVRWQPWSRVKAAVSGKAMAECAAASLTATSDCHGCHELLPLQGLNSNFWV